MRDRANKGWTDYPDHFSSEVDADEYDQLFKSDKCEQVCWEIERAALAVVLQGLLVSAKNRDTRALDFACGTGRITVVLVESGWQPVGLDASPAMIAPAQRRLPEVEFQVGLLGEGETDEWLSAHGGPFRLVTAFRFFLNAPADQRETVLAKLVNQLDVQGCMIVNNHGSGPSLRNLGLRLRRNRDATRLSQREFLSILHRAGLSIDRQWGGQMFPRKLYGLSYFARVVVGIERLIPRSAFGRGLARRFGAHQTYVCRHMMVTDDGR